MASQMMALITLLRAVTAFDFVGHVFGQIFGVLSGIAGNGFAFECLACFFAGVEATSDNLSPAWSANSFAVFKASSALDRCG